MTYSALADVLDADRRCSRSRLRPLTRFLFGDDSRENAREGKEKLDVEGVIGGVRFNDIRLSEFRGLCSLRACARSES